jgi:hypothetical protein
MMTGKLVRIDDYRHLRRVPADPSDAMAAAAISLMCLCAAMFALGVATGMLIVSQSLIKH